MRTLSNLAKSSIAAAQTEEVFLYLLKISHDDLDDDILLVNNTVDVTAGADTYSAFPFAVNLPDDVEDQMPSVELVVDAVDQTIITAVRSISTAPTVELSLVLASQPTTVEAGPYEFTVRSVDYNAETVTFELGYEDILNEAFPAHTFDIRTFPGLG